VNRAHAVGPVLTVALMALAAAGLTIAWGPAAAQSTFRGDAAHTGVQPGEAPRVLPRVRWSFPTGDRVVSSPAWADGVVYVGSDDGNLYAIDAASGRQRWMHRTGGPVSGSPAVADGRVYVTSYDGRLHAVDAATGALRWKFATQGERRFEAKGLHGMQPRSQTFADPFDVYLSSPVVTGGLVIFGSGDGHVYAVDAASGEQRWRFATGDVVHASPAVSDGRVFIGSWDGKLYALDAASGRELWHAQTGLDPLMANQQGFQSSPAVAGDTVYTGCRDAHLYAFDVRTGQEKWRFSTGASWVISSPAVLGGRVYFATSDSSLVHSVEAATGKPVWQQQASAYMFASPSLAGGVLLQGELNGSLQAREAATGALLWEFQTEAARINTGWGLTSERRFNAPMLYPSGWHDAMAVGAARQSALGSFFSTPLVVGRTIYVGSADGRVYALE
jgi:outer membrane protein assembly factor BamB